MIRALYVYDYRDNKGNIISYVLSDINGQIVNVTAKQIKQAIKQGHLDVLGLQIDKAGRLIKKRVADNEEYRKMYFSRHCKYCTQINYNENGEIINYLLESPALINQPMPCQITEKQLYDDLVNNKYYVTNLRVHNGKIIKYGDKYTLDKIKKVIIKTASIKRSDTENKILQTIAKLKMLGKVDTIKTFDGAECYYIQHEDNKAILYIPDDVTIVNDKPYGIFMQELRKILGYRDIDLKVVGGHNLINAQSMFELCHVNSINFTLFDTSKIENMERMFKGFSFKDFSFIDFDTNKCDKVLDLSSFKTQNVKNYTDIFKEIGVPKIIIDNFVINDGANTSEMFTRCPEDIEVQCIGKVKQLYNEQIK